MEGEKLTPGSPRPDTSESNNVKSTSEKANGKLTPNTETNAVSSDQNAVKDFRELAPANDFDCYSLERAIKLTHNSFLKRTGVPAAFTDCSASYGDQYRQILAESQTWWTKEHPEDKDLDKIPCLTVWGAEQFKDYVWALQEEAAEEAAGEVAEEVEDEVDDREEEP